MESRFPGGDVIVGPESIKRYLSTGRDIIKMRGVEAIEEGSNDRGQIVISEISDAVNRTILVCSLQN